MKRLIGVCACAVLLLSFPASALTPENAQSNTTKQLIDHVSVTIEQVAQGIPEKYVLALLEENPDAGHITIHGWGKPGGGKRAAGGAYALGIIPGEGGYYARIETEKTSTKAEYAAADYFCFSAAKGETGTLAKNYAEQLSLFIDGLPFSKTDLGLTSSVNAAYPKGTPYSGPSEDTEGNSREFRLRLYAEEGEWTQSKTYYNSWDDSVLGTEERTGSYINPTCYLTYSIDLTIE